MHAFSVVGARYVGIFKSFGQSGKSLGRAKAPISMTRSPQQLGMLLIYGQALRLADMSISREMDLVE